MLGTDDIGLDILIRLMRPPVSAGGIPGSCAVAALLLGGVNLDYVTASRVAVAGMLTDVRQYFAQLLAPLIVQVSLGVLQCH
ncbi:hypothetical protein BG74_01120 [Sodalis-like endosymbiont of Proechinophthirus fluctus]|nr:hypothetical protein BG74_07100 [Sodalis-like endosymbiont of Proechinophthirus fluctus]KYP96952.1 hypothetical protein BG74_06640 [Sodalis-like endosymbiont of Proechinophthirus fluctus]KYP97717.1 hypothetical protein BG74_01120 [Sodalis-like endosymbiont of Proechinophthirus fluctus]